MRKRPLPLVERGENNPHGGPLKTEKRRILILLLTTQKATKNFAKHWKVSTEFRYVIIEKKSDYLFSHAVHSTPRIKDEGQRTIVEMESDGNCLFRSLSDQLFWDHGAKHEDIRSEVCDFMESHEEEFSVFLVLDDDDEDASDFNSYIESMRESGEWGGNLELVAAARLYW